jgi:hypothetical protein
MVQPLSESRNPKYAYLATSDFEYPAMAVDNRNEYQNANTNRIEV